MPDKSWQALVCEVQRLPAYLAMPELPALVHGFRQEIRRLEDLEFRLQQDITNHCKTIRHLHKRLAECGAPDSVARASGKDTP